MSGVLVYSNVILDVFENDAACAEWFESVLNQYAASHTLYINPVIYSEISVGFQRVEKLENAFTLAGFQFLPIPKEALFLAAKAFLQ